MLELLDHRERGYVRQPVSPTHIESYAGRRPDDDVASCAIYGGRDEKWNDELMPNPDYLRLCIEAAEQWGPEFLHDFLATTFIGRAPLLDFTTGREL